MKKSAIAALIMLFIISATSCGDNDTDRINPISREAGSGTRDAFTSLTGIAVEGKDRTWEGCEITSSTFVVIKSVEDDQSAIGYVSLGTLTGDVKSVSINGVSPSVENIKNGKYPLVRDFNIVTSGDTGQDEKDFINFICGDEGRLIIEQQGYVSKEENLQQSFDNTEEKPVKDHQTQGEKRRIVIAGSTSVAPLMEVLAETYMEIRPDIVIEIQQTGSGAGITSVLEGACGIGMSSRELTEEEKKKGASSTSIASDGIVVIVNPKNPADNMSLEQIRDIFTGKTVRWR